MRSDSGRDEGPRPVPDRLRGRRAPIRHEVIVHSAADSRAFVEAMLDPPPVNARLKYSVRRYRAATNS